MFLIYECLTGQLPYEAPEVVALMCMKSLQAPPSMLLLRNDIPAALDAVVLACLDPDPTKRPPDCQAVANALRQAAGLG